jgi:hypothetical protein
MVRAETETLLAMFLSSRWLVASLVASSAAACALAAGCSSSSSGSSPDAATGDSSVEASPAAEAGQPQADGACYVDASLTAFAESDASAAPCAKCVNENCDVAIQTCASDCTCISLFQCLADAGVAAMGLGSAGTAAAGCAGSNALNFLLNNPGVSGLVSCVQGVCASACPADGGPVLPPPEAGTETTDAGTQTTDAGTDAADASGD